MNTSTQTKSEIVSGQIFTKAAELIVNKDYKEKKNTEVYNKCNRLFVDHSAKAFWFTTEKHVQHTKNLRK